MNFHTYSVLILFLQWTTFTEKCLGQKTLLTLIGDTCIANTSSAMAMIYNLSDSKLKHMSNFRLEASESKSLTQRKGLKICNTPRCFTLGSWSNTNSLESRHVNNLITDWRWENFTTIMTKFTRTSNEILDYQEAAEIVPALEKVTIPFSVQVEKEAHVFICDGDEVLRSNCIWFMLEAWGGNMTAVRICKAYEIQWTYDGIAPKEKLCSQRRNSIVHENIYPHFLNENIWKHFKIVKTGNRYSLEKQNGDEIIHVTDFSNIQPTRVFFHTKSGLGLWKVHNFNYIYTDTTYSALESRILKPSGGSSCLAMFVVMCAFCSMEITLTSSGFDLHHSTEKTQNEQWKEIKLAYLPYYVLEVDLKIIPTSTKLSNNFWAISHLRECYSDEQSFSIWAHHHEVVKRNLETYAQGVDKSVELTQYLQSHLAKLDENPLKFWEEMKSVYPQLSKIALKYLSVVATSIPPERLFSNAGQILTQQRNRLIGTRLSKLLFLHNCNRNMF